MRTATDMQRLKEEGRTEKVLWAGRRALDFLGKKPAETGDKEGPKEAETPIAPEKSVGNSPEKDKEDLKHTDDSSKITPVEATKPQEEKNMEATKTPLMKELIGKANEQGVTNEQVDELLAAFPEMQQEGWWERNAKQTPGRALKHRLGVLKNKKDKAQEAAWSDDEIKTVATAHKSGKPVDPDKLAAAVRRGFVSASSAMNRDF